MRTLRVALLGAAHVHVADHLAVLEGDPAAELVGIYSGDRSDLGDMTGGAGPPSLGLAELLGRAEIAVVDSTTAAHAELVPAAVRAGLAVFVEKPLANSAAQTRAVAALIDASGVPFATGMFLRCLPALRHVRALLADGALGELSAVQARFTHPGLFGGAFTATAAWMRERDQGGTGGFADLALHLLDTLRWLRPTASLMVHGARLLLDGSDDLDVGGAALLDWAGTPTTVHAGWTGRPGGLHMHLEGSLGSATVQDGDLTVCTDQASTKVGDPPQASTALAAFLADLRGQHQWETPTTADAIATADILDAISSLASAHR